MPIAAVKMLLPPANEVCEGYVFTGVCLSTWGGAGGMHGCSGGGCAWLLQGACMVAPGGGMHGCSGGACVVAHWGGMCGCSRGGMHGCSGGHVWLLWGGMRGCSGGHAWLLRGACVVALGGGGGMHGFFDEIRSMSGRYASYWNAFLFTFAIALSWEQGTG